MRNWINLFEVNLSRPVSASQAAVSPSGNNREFEVQVKASDLLPYVVHAAGVGQEVDSDRAAVNAELRQSIQQNGVNEVLLLDVDLTRSQARLANGNHRVVMANEINPNMMIPVRIRERSDWKRPLTSAKPYQGQFSS